MRNYAKDTDTPSNTSETPINFIIKDEIQQQQQEPSDIGFRFSSLLDKSSLSHSLIQYTGITPISILSSPTYNSQSFFEHLELSTENKEKSNCESVNTTPLFYEPALRDMPHRFEVAKSHSILITKFTETIGEFFKKLAELNENFSKSLHQLVRQFVAKNNEYKKEKNFCPGTLFNYWESVIGEVEQQSLAYSYYSQDLNKRIATPIKSIACHKREILKKIFISRDEFILEQNRHKEDMHKLHKEYSENYCKMMSPTAKPSLKETLRLQCHNSHNDYVIQISATNTFKKAWQQKHLLDLLNDVDDVLLSLYDGFKDYIALYIQSTKDMFSKFISRFTAIEVILPHINHKSDVSLFIKLQDAGSVPEFREFSYQYPDPSATPEERILKGELICSKLTQQALGFREQILRNQKKKLERNITNLRKEYASLQELNKQYIDYPDYRDKDSSEIAIMIKKIELSNFESDHSVMEVKLEMISGLDLPNASTSRIDSLKINISVSESYLQEDLEVENRAERAHKFSPFTYKKLKKCDYCQEQLGVIKNELKCEICLMRIHRKCQLNVSYCLGIPIKRKEITFNNNDFIDERKSDEKASLNQSDDGELLYSIIENELKYPEYNQPKSSPKIPTIVDSIEQLPKKATCSQNVVDNFLKDPSQFIDEKNPLATKTTKIFDSKEHECYSTKHVNVSPGACVALYDYEAQDEQDISFRKGDIMELVDTDDPEWWHATLREKSGFIPFNYVYTLLKGQRIYIAIYDFNPQSEEEIKLKSGQIVFVIRDEGDGWLQGTDGVNTGIFPTSYVTPFEEQYKI